MKNSTEIKTLIKKHKSELDKKYHIKSIGIFGSTARGDATEVSDVDILAEFEKPIGLDFVILGNDLEKILGVKVDLVTLNSVKPSMLEYIKQDLVYV